MLHYDSEGLDYFAHKIYRCSIDNIDRKEKGLPKKGVMPRRPLTAFAELVPGPLAPDIKGLILFKELPEGTEIMVEVTGLPGFQPATANSPQIGPHGFHIHEYGNIEVGDASNSFPSTGEHWNPTNQPHGNHAGDFPVLFSNHGRAAMTFFTDRFRVSDIIGRSVVIHQSPDDYRSQPAGNSGKKLAAGIIRMEQ